MNNMKISQLMDTVENMLSKKRMEHTLGVVAEAKRLALRYGTDPLKAEFAALAHDMARCKSTEEIIAYSREFGIDPRCADSPELVHGIIAAELLKRDWFIEDKDILNAVRYHTTGRRGMSSLEKIIYLADAIEPGRQYPGIDELRAIAYSDLDEACIEVMNKTVEYVNNKGNILDKNTIMARDHLLAKGRREDG